MRVLNYLLMSAIELSSATNSTPVNVDQMNQADLVASISNTTPVGGSFTGVDVNPGTDTITLNAHSFLTGLKVQFTTDGTLPAPLLVLTDYFIIRTSANAFKVASSLVNALAGTAIDLTDGGAGNHTVTPVALAGCTVKLQKSDEPATGTAIWVDVPSSSQACGSLPGTLTWSAADIGYVNLRAVGTVTAGEVTVSVRINAKGP